MSSFHTDKRQINLSWSTIQDMISILQEMVLPLQPKRIVAVARGGLIPATMLSHRLGVPLEVITAKSYDGTQKVLQASQIDIIGLKPEYLQKDTVIIDDIMDTGDTWGAIINQAYGYPKQFQATFAVLVKKTEAKYVNHKTFVMQVPQDTWINFPWE